MMAALLKIVKLDEAVINRIAAGEVVQRPSAALKEMLENSLDAGATCITVIARGGGMQLLQITDNGHGIAKEDMSIACERFTTSKLTTFEDLKSISTFGFRGEALASITHVAHVTIVTKTKASPCAYKATYSDGHIVATKAGEKAEPKPAAGTTGTTITVEDLFYNMPTRKQAFKNLNEEYQRILDVITKYSIHYGDKKISFTCKKHGQNTPDLHCPVNPTSSTLENIKIVFGSSIARELISFSCSTTATATSSSSSSSNSNDGNAEVMSVSVEGKVTNANYSHKKAIYIIFINNRLVECASIRRTIENVYMGILPKHMHPFVYLSIQMPPQHIDVNVHPTKKEVHFLFEEELLELIHMELTKLLSSANESRSFLIQTTLFDPSSNNNLLYSDKQSTAVQAPNETRLPERNPSSEENVDGEMNGFTFSKFQSRGSSSSPHGDSNKPPVVSVSLQDFSNDDWSSGDHIQQGKEAASSRKSSAVVSGSVAAGTKRSSSSTSSAKVAGNKMIRTDPNLMKINSFFLKTTTAVTKTNVEVSDAEKNSGTTPELGIETPPDRDSKSSSTTIQQPQHEAPFSFVKNRKGSCLCCDGQPDPSTHVDGLADEPRKEMPAPSGAFKLPTPIIETLCPYLSIRGMIRDMHKNKSSTIESILKGNTFVGVVSHSLSLVQWGTKLLLVNHTALARSLFFQLAIRRFAEHPALELSEAVNIEEFVLAALEDPRLAHLRPSPSSTARKGQDGRAGCDVLQEEEDSGHGYDIHRIAKGTALLLWEKADMLREYFNIGVENISGQYMLTSLPALLERYEPLPQELPEFLLRLAADTIWTDESECFQSIASNLAELYSKFSGDDDDNGNDSNDHDRLSRSLEGLVYPALRAHLLPSEIETPLHDTFVEIAALEQLYKVFERC